jgi:drug/metabolite transporter (DMT)-like permease
MMRKQLIADIGLFLVTVGWGSSFILTKNSLDSMSTYNFLAVRFILAFIISSLIFLKNIIKIDKKTLKYGFFLGAILFSSYAFQTVGLNYTTPSKSAFVTGINVILVPIFSSLLMKIIPPKKSIISVILAFIGLGLLTLTQNITGVNIGDIYTFLCAVIFAMYIILLGKYTLQTESVSLAIIQLAVVGILSLITTFLIENPIMPSGKGLWFNIIFLSMVCTSGAFIIQSVAQRFTTPTHTALIFTGEPVFAAIFAYFIYGEILSLKGIIGSTLILTGLQFILSSINFSCIIGSTLILTGMLLTEIDFKKLFKKEEKPSSFNV